MASDGDFSGSSKSVSTALRDQRCPFVMERVAPRVPAEIIVIVKDQNSAAAFLLAVINIGGGEAGQTGADDDEIVFFTHINNAARKLHKFAVPYAVADFIEA